MSEKSAGDKFDRYFRLFILAKSACARAYRYFGAKIFGEKFYHKPIIDSILSYAAKNRTFIDIGAHIGVITTAVAHRFEYCLAFEPLPQNVAQLRYAVESNRLRNCQVFACALGDRVGVTNLYCSESSSTNNSLIKRDRLKKCIKVPVTTLDLIVEETNVIEPFFIKIDVEGYEPFVFRGAHQTLAKSCTILSEFWPWALKSGGYKAKDYLKFMKKYGYIACDLKGRPITQKKLVRFCELFEDDRFVETDLLFQKMVSS